MAFAYYVDDFLLHVRDIGSVPGFTFRITNISSRLWINIQMSSTAFVKRLASNDDKVRDQALESLKKFLGAKNLTKLLLLEHDKLWRGLFFAMWYCDKPIPQQRLAEDLGQLFSEVVFKTSVMPFYHAFWDIMIKEWPLIDKWRVDKYLMLIRRVVRHMFKFLSKQSWNESLVKDYLKTVQDTVLLGLDKVPSALPYHVIDLYLDELERVMFKVDGEEEEIENDDEEENEKSLEEKQEIVAEVPVNTLISPFEKLSTSAKMKTLRERSREVLDDERLVEWGLKETGPETANSDDEWKGFA